MLDRLLHQYTTATSATLTVNSEGTEDVWRTAAAPQLAFSGATYLTDAMLAIAALHLRSHNPNDRQLVQASHAYMASSLSEYCNALEGPTTNPTPRPCS